MAQRTRAAEAEEDLSLIPWGVDFGRKDFGRADFGRCFRSLCCTLAEECVSHAVGSPLTAVPFSAFWLNFMNTSCSICEFAMSHIQSPLAKIHLAKDHWAKFQGA